MSQNRLQQLQNDLLARILFNRIITNYSDSNLLDAQCGFRSGHSTINKAFAMH